MSCDPGHKSASRFYCHMVRRALLFAAALWIIPSQSVQATAVTPEEMAAAGHWTAAKLTGGERPEPPFSFTYGGRPSSELLKTWEFKRDARKLDAQRTQHTLTYTEPKTGLVLRCVAVEYHDFPTVEWTLYFNNSGQADTPILENIQALDAAWERPGDAEFLLHHAAGSLANKSDYAPRETALGPGATKRITAAGGRPTNTDWSYFNVQWGGEGAIVVVGWPGQWAAEFNRDAGRGLHVRAGQELTHFKLLPGEEVRSPLIVVQFWKGDFVRAQNVWRRWMMAHGMPRPGGKLPPPQFVASSSRAYEEMIKANTENQIMHIDRYLEEGLKLDYWWMDAGWYVQQLGWPQVGTWEVDPKRFPKGLRPISDHAHAKGVKILVWFEPERVAPGTWLYQKHPEWLLSIPPSESDPMYGLCSWTSEQLGGSDPCVTHNPTPRTRSTAGIRWEPGRLAFHPGGKGEYSVVRWTAAEDGPHAVHAAFLAIDQQATTDIHVWHRGRAVFDGLIQLAGHGKQALYDGKLKIGRAHV